MDEISAMTCAIWQDGNRTTFLKTSTGANLTCKQIKSILKAGVSSLSW